MTDNNSLNELVMGVFSGETTESTDKSQFKCVVPLLNSLISLQNEMLVAIKRPWCMSDLSICFNHIHFPVDSGNFVSSLLAGRGMEIAPYRHKYQP